MAMADPLFLIPMSMFIYNLLPLTGIGINTTQVVGTKVAETEVLPYIFNNLDLKVTHFYFQT